MPLYQAQNVFVCVYAKDFPLKIHMQKAFEHYTFDSS